MSVGDPGFHWGEALESLAFFLHRIHARGQLFTQRNQNSEPPRPIRLPVGSWRQCGQRHAYSSPAGSFSSAHLTWHLHVLCIHYTCAHTPAVGQTPLGHCERGCGNRNPGRLFLLFWSILGSKLTPTDVTVFFLALTCFLFLAVLPFNSPFYFSIFHFYLSFTSHLLSSSVSTLTPCLLMLHEPHQHPQFSFPNSTLAATLTSLPSWGPGRLLAVLQAAVLSWGHENEISNFSSN